MTRPGPHESIAPALGRFGRLSVAIVATILAGPPSRSSGCARCSAQTPELNRARSVQSASPGQPKRLASHEARPRRLRAELKIAAVGGSYHVCVRACDGGFFPAPYVGDRNSLAERSARRCVRTPRRNSIPCRLAARSSNPFRRPACRTPAYPTPANSSRLSIRIAPAGARVRAGRRRWLGSRRGFSATRAIFW
jgi:hypothetical protein